MSIVILGFCGFLYAGIKFCGKIYWASTDFRGLSVALSESKYRAFTREIHALSKYDKATILDRLKNACNRINESNVTDYFIENRVAYFDIVLDMNRTFPFTDKVSVKAYPILRDYNFQQVKDPFSTMQELSMFLGGVIPRDVVELANVSDKDRITQYGFDKFSFKHPIKL